MLAALTLSFLVFYVTGVHSVLMIGENSKLCVPTEKVEGPRHICVCGTDGVFHCLRRTTSIVDHSEINLILRQRQCEPNSTYQEQHLICTCNDNGYWRSKNCFQNFRVIRPSNLFNTQSLRTGYSCIPNKSYLVDCNVCICGDNGLINVDACSTRTCSKGHKIDKCTHGDILRTTDELCACSDIDYYIDRLCISISEHRVQRLNNEHFDVLVKQEKSLKTTPVYSDRCSQADLVKVDCNSCYCIAGLWACTNKKCATSFRKRNAIRNRKKIFLSLPEVFDDKEKCVPRKKYRYRCNTCICTDKRILSCTSMICLEALLTRV